MKFHRYLKILSIEKFLYILVLFLPFSLVSGPFFPDFTAVLLSLYFLYKQFNKKKLKYFNNLIFKIILLFNLWLITSSLMSDNLLFSLKTSIFYFRFIIFSLAIWYFIECYKNFIYYFFYSLFFSFIFLLIDGYFQYFYGYNLIGLELQRGPRVSSFFGKELVLGSYLSRMLPLLLGLYFFNIDKLTNKKSMTFAISIIIILSEVLVFLSGERTSFFFINLSAFLIIIFIKNFKLIRIFTLIIAFLIIILLINFKPTTKDRMIDLTVNQIGVSDNKLNIFSEQYENYYITALNIFKDNIIAGSGPRTFRIECSNIKYKIDEKSCSTHPHNLYFELLAETGIVGFLFIFLLFIKIIFYLFKEWILNKKFKNYDVSFYNFKICLIVCLVVNLWPFIPTGSFFNNWLNIIYYLPLGFLMYSIYKKKENKFIINDH
jgi:O-antigen ligase